MAQTPLAIGINRVSAPPVFVAQGQPPGYEQFDADTVAYGGSLAKQMTGACAALLSRSDRIEVEAPIRSWLPELPDWSGTIRVRHLIHHTAGLPDNETVWNLMVNTGESNWTSTGVLAALTQMHEFEPAPGQVYSYSNVGYICLAAICERASGKQLADLAREELFRPLRMDSTTFWSGPAPSPPNAAALPTDEPAALSVGDGGVWTTVHDLLRWNDGLLTDRLGVSDLIHTPGTLDDGTPLDYAWGVTVRRESHLLVHSHGGHWNAATAKLVRLPELRASFAVLALHESVEQMVTLSSGFNTSS